MKPLFASAALLLSGLLFGLFVGCVSDRPLTTALHRLQGTWEGFMLERNAPTGPYVKPEDANKLSVTIKGNSLYFYGGEEHWFDTTFTLPVGTDPPQLHATIHRPERHSGDTVIAFFKFEGETLTLGGIRSRDSEADWPESFEATVDGMAGRYELRRVRAKKERGGD